LWLHIIKKDRCFGGGSTGLKGALMTFSELKCKDVVNIRDCKKIGKISDLEFDHHTGCICSVIVPGGGKLSSFLHCEPGIVIPYKDIHQIGPDIILVDVKC
jgi:YlmC/YmxH family sporulation protein